jgi:hypothetical protein
MLVLIVGCGGTMLDVGCWILDVEAEMENNMTGGQ